MSSWKFMLRLNWFDANKWLSGVFGVGAVVQTPFKVSYFDIFAIVFTMLFFLKLLLSERANKLFLFVFCVLSLYVGSVFLSDFTSTIGFSYPSLGRGLLLLFNYIAIYYLLKTNAFDLKSFLFSSAVVLVFFDSSYADILTDSNVWRHQIGEALSLMGYVFSLSFSRKNFLFSMAVVAVVIALNLIFDFRGMAGLGVLCGLLVFWRRSIDVGVYRKLIYLLLFTVVFVAVMVGYIQAGKDNQRRDYSNIARSAMTLHAVNDLFTFRVLGNGFDAFKEDFTYPAVGNSKLEADKDGAIQLHGYFWLFSYEAGKIAVLFYLCFLGLALTAVIDYMRKRNAMADEYLLVVVYVIYCSFMHVFSGFDRWLLPFGIAVVVLSCEKRSRI